jgi:hypothetical protein
VMTAGYYSIFINQDWLAHFIPEPSRVSFHSIYHAIDFRSIDAPLPRLEACSFHGGCEGTFTYGTVIMYPCPAVYRTNKVAM